MSPSIARTLTVAAAACLWLAGTAARAQTPEVVKPRLELQVFLLDKAVGTEILRGAKGAEANYFSTEANLQDKVAKVWRGFKQRTHLQLTPAGEVQSFDRWIDVTGATQGTKLFQFNGQWRIAVTEAAFEGKKPKPKVTDVKATQPLVVLDERLPALVVVAQERMAETESFSYVRVDNATFGTLRRTVEPLVDGKGARFVRTWLKGDKVAVWVLRDANGKVVQVQGLDGWRGVAKEAKPPQGLKPADDDKAGDAPAPATRTDG
ncbi:MAG: hypothetical protein FJ100_02820 [Deltaproteobacteria bacterium]|nr:hypothetical protein [Deltaproteobacteria bacterium]